MLDAVRAEALKLHRHKATWMMVWIYPVGFTLLVAGMLIYGLFEPPAPPPKPVDPAQWARDSTMLWSAPMSAPGRFLIAGFAALVFAGEYGWNTWKLVIPARARWQLIAAKWVVTIAFVFVALLVADIVGMIGELLMTFEGDTIPRGVTFGAVAAAHAEMAGRALLPIAYTVAFAGLFAILTQSILATVILSIAMIVIEGLLQLAALFGYRYIPDVTYTLVEALPFYSMANLNAFAGGPGKTIVFGPGVTLSASWGTSFAILTAWILAAGALTQLRFARQDIN